MHMQNLSMRYDKNGYKAHAKDINQLVRHEIYTQDIVRLFTVQLGVKIDEWNALL
jgi:hypothetical protein